MARNHRQHLTIEEACARTGLSDDTIRRRLANGSLPNAHREAPGSPSSRWRIPERDLVDAGLLKPDPHPEPALAPPVTTAPPASLGDTTPLWRLIEQQAAVIDRLERVIDTLTRTGGA